MSHRSIVNEQLIQGAAIFTISSNTTVNFAFELAQFENGNIFIWGSTDYTDGDYVLSFAESPDGNFANSTPISSDRIIIPEVATEAAADPLTLDASTQGIQMGSDLMRQVEIRGIATPFAHAVFTSTNVTSGATFLRAWLGVTERSPISLKQVP